jgi:lipoprotein-anchoring transpeptidase ErfK/SrfK
MWAAALMVAGTLASGRATAAEAPVVAASTPVVRRIVVSIPDRKLAVVENGHVVQTYDVSVGAPNSPSPVGTFTIINRVTNPTYYHPGKMIAPGSQNPVGTRWIGLNQKGYGIHGTDEPDSIGFAKSHGCIRLRNADIERLFKRVRTGDVVELHGERTPDIAHLFDTVH